jgi:exodeoxyribonuclease VII large subunit
MPETYITVSQLNRYIKSVFDGDLFLSKLTVQGEVSNFKFHSSGHWYFSLKDETSVINCVMFRSYAKAVPFVPYNGLKVFLIGKVSAYEKNGSYQFYSTEMYPVGKGSLALAYEQLKAKLNAEGLFARKRAIPFMPDVVGIITSPTGAAVQDIIRLSQERNPAVKLVVIPAIVQGSGAAESLASAISIANEWGEPDVLVLTRGGGSQEDLWPFNEERTARAIFASQIPVVSAVGHETDYSISDLVADLRAPTPSAAVELIMPSKQILVSEVYAEFAALNRAAEKCLAEKKMSLDTQIKRNLFMHTIHCLAYHKQNLERLSIKQKEQAYARLKYDKLRAQAIVERLESLSPLKVLTRGYTLITNKKNIHIHSAKSLKYNQEINIRFWDGFREAKIVNENISLEDVNAKEKTNI